MKKAPIIVCSLLLLLALLGPLYMASLVDHWWMRGATPGQKTGYREWRRQKLVIPTDALDVKPFQKDTQAAVQAFHQAYTRQEKQIETVLLRNYFGGGSKQSYGLSSPLGDALRYPYTRSCTDTLFLQVRPGNIDLPVVQQDLTSIQPVLKAFQKVVRRPDYEISAFFTPNPQHSTLFIDGTIKLVRLQAFAEILEQRFDAVMETVEDMVKAGKGSPYDAYFLQGYAAETFWMATDTWRELILACSDIDMLRASLQRQNDLAGKQHFYLRYLPASDPDSGFSSPTLLLSAPRQLTYENVNALDDIRYFKQMDYKPDLEKARNMHPVHASSYMWLKYIEDVALPEAEKKGDQERVGSLQKEARRLRYNTSVLSAGRLRNLQTDYFHRPKMDVIVNRGRVIRTHFDLLRLLTVRKIYKLEHGEPSASMQDLVPSLLPSEPFDRFAKDRAPYANNGKAFYSVGPDGKDQKGSLLYDPTNGTLSGGDILE